MDMNQGLVLVTTKSVKHQSTKPIPSHTLQPTLNRLKPARSRTFNVHRGDSDPQQWLDPVHVKVIHRTGSLQLGIFPSEHWKFDFGQLPMIGANQIEVRCVMAPGVNDVCRLNTMRMELGGGSYR
jgi:hypothetical protein